MPLFVIGIAPGPVELIPALDVVGEDNPGHGSSDEPGSSMGGPSLLDKFHPPPPSPLFAGRTKDLNYMHAFFTMDPEGTLLLCGVPGSGKTQLALKFAQETSTHR